MIDLTEPIQGSSFVERRALAPLTPHVAAVWVQQVGPGAEPYVQRSVPHGGIEVSCVLGDRLNVIGPHSRARSQILPDGATVVGVRFEPWAGRAVEMEHATTVFRAVYGWPTTFVGDELHAPYAAPTSGGSPFQVWELTPARAFGFPADGESNAPTRWRFTAA